MHSWAVRLSCGVVSASLVAALAGLAPFRTPAIESGLKPSPVKQEGVVQPKRSDWPMLGGTPSRNMVNLVEKNLPEQWNLNTGENVKWKVRLGTQSYGGPVVAGGKIYIGTNNVVPRHPRQYAPSGIPGDRSSPQDKGVLMCFREADGAFLWQAVHDKLPAGLVNDWPEQGIASSPVVEGNRLYYVSNRCELVCADTEGFADGNQGVQDEKYRDAIDADFIWTLDMIKELGVFPHNLAASSPLIWGDLLFVITGNGHDETHNHLPAPHAPSFIAVHKKTGQVVWKDNAPGKNVLHAQWSSPTLAEVKGQPQIIFPGGDGWLRAYEPATGTLLWKFDGNPKSAQWKLGGKGDRSDFVAPVVFHEGKVYATMGQDPEHGDGVGRLWCIDPSRASPTNVDLSPVGDPFDPQAPVNQNSGLVWHLGGLRPGTDPAARDYLFRRSLSFCAIKDGLCFVADLSGYVHCVDARSGQRYWEYDVFENLWSAPLWADDKIYVGGEDGRVFVFQAGRACRLLATMEMDSSIQGTIVAANGVLYVKTKSYLYALAKR